jgi:hypothetical protein
MSDLIWMIPSVLAFVIGIYVLVCDEIDGGPGDWMH